MAVQDLKLKGIREEMDRGTKRAMEQAKALREEADKIDQHNARLQNAQNLVNLIGSAAGLANAAAGGGGGTGTTTKTTTIYYDGPNGYAMGRTVTTTKP